MPVGNAKPTTRAEAVKKARRRWWRLLVLVGAVAALAVAAKVFALGERLGELRSWIASLGSWGPVAFILVYIGATCAAIPGSALTVGAGAVFGSVMGVVYVSVASTIGASLAFLISRYFARETIARWLSKNEKFERLDRLSENHGAIIVALTRLVPLFPFNLLNYGFGITRVRFWTYVFWSWFCMLPGTVLYVVGADTVTTAMRERRVPWALVGVLVGAAALLVIVVRSARSRLAARESSAAAAEEKEDRDDARA